MFCGARRDFCWRRGPRPRCVGGGDCCCVFLARKCRGLWQRENTAVVESSARRVCLYWSKCLGGFIGENRIRRFALVSQGARICASVQGSPSSHLHPSACAIKIGAHAWIAAEAYVGPGVKAGEGAVLGARGCTFDELEPWTIYTGNPAKALRPRKVLTK